MGRSSFGKLSRDRAKKAKAQAKRERRQAGADPMADEAVPAAEGAGADDGLSTADLLQRIEEVHRLYDEGRMTEDDFQEAKADLLGRLSVD